jgi:N-acyl-D-aspartate/D-glutamate deacylase
MALDLVIRNGRIVDGTGLPGYVGDVGIAGGRIVSVGRPLPDTGRAIDATGKVIAPGFVDPHTHYDAQLCFDPYAYPAIEHGVTTVVTGNCSLSLAPVRSHHRDHFGAMFRLIEEMPEAAFASGVDWAWGEGFGDMLDSLVQRGVALNVAPLVGHSVLRLYVLGDQARRAATPAEVAAMADVLGECLRAGAVGLSTSFVDMDDSLLPVPSRWARRDELAALCAVLGEHGRMLQIVHEFFDPERTVTRVEQLAQLSRTYGIPTTFSPLFHNDVAPAVQMVMDAVGQAWASGARVWPQVQTRPIDISWTLNQRSIMFLIVPDWWSVVSLPTREEKLAAFADPATRDRLVGAMNFLSDLPGSPLDARTFVVRETVLDRNAELVGRTLGEIADERGTSAGDLMVDLAVEEDLGTWFVRAAIGHRDSAAVGALLADPLVHVGASDGGAHVGSFSTFGDTGYLFSQFVRATPALRLEEAVKRITADPCAIWGLGDRGRLAEGLAADVVVFDPASIDRGPEVASDDFPGAGIRWIRHSVGVDSVVVNGELTWSAGGGYEPAARAGVIATR